MAGDAASEFGWSTSLSGSLLGGITGVAASVFGDPIFDDTIFDPGIFDVLVTSWTTYGTGVFEGMTNHLEVAFGWSTSAHGHVQFGSVKKGKNRRTRWLMLPQGVWYQPGTNPEGRLQ